jgi:tetratricopeptide (TPR) repeat protein
MPSIRHERCVSAILLGTLIIVTPPANALTALPAHAPSSGSERSTTELLDEGIVAIEAFHYPRAAARFKEALAIDPHLMQAHYGSGLAALGQRDKKGAERALRRALQLSGDAPEVRYALGVAHFVFGDLRHAENALQSAIQADRYFLEARYALGIVRSMRGDLLEAEIALRDALRIDSRAASARYQLGAVLARAGDLEGALRELAAALLSRPGLMDARPEDPIVFARRAIRPTGAGHPDLSMPLPVPRASIGWPRSLPRADVNTPDTGIPDWFLYYQMALTLKGTGHWLGATDMLQRAIGSKDRAESLAVVGDRLIDYSPHFHLAESFYRLGRFRDAFLHLEIARNESGASPDALRSLEVLIRRDRSRPRLLLQRIPPRTTSETILVRGVILSDEEIHKVDVGGREASLRPASAADISSLLEDERQPADRSARIATHFEVPSYPLESIGPHLIRIRPMFRDPTKDGDLIEVLIVRLPAPDRSARAATRGGAP